MWQQQCQVSTWNRERKVDCNKKKQKTNKKTGWSWKAASPPLLSAGWGIPQVYTLLGGGEVEEWKGCTFLLDGITLPISREWEGVNWKITPHFSKLKKNTNELCRLRGGKGNLLSTCCCFWAAQRSERESCRGARAFVRLAEVKCAVRGTWNALHAPCGAFVACSWQWVWHSTN